jgi:hypothetical protein
MPGRKEITVSADKISASLKSPPRARKMAGERDARAARRDSGDDRNRRRQGDGREHEAVPDTLKLIASEYDFGLNRIREQIWSHGDE